MCEQMFVNAAPELDFWRFHFGQDILPTFTPTTVFMFVVFFLPQNSILLCQIWRSVFQDGLHFELRNNGCLGPIFLAIFGPKKHERQKKNLTYSSAKIQFPMLSDRTY